MRSVIFNTAARVIAPIMLLLSVIVLLRGHNEPGGGFVGGLLAASAVTLYALAFSAEAARRMLRLDPRAWIGIGLVTAIVSGMPALVFGQPFLTGRWVSVPTPGFDDPIKLGTPLLFDIGVYFTVLGVVLLMVLSLEEVRHGRALGD